MDLTTAQQAAEIAQTILILQDVIAKIDIAISEGWSVTSLQATAPATGASVPAGTIVNLLPLGPADEANSSLGLATAKQTYETKRAELTAQLAAL